MANITREQITKINNMCSNEWMLDVDYFLFHNEKTLIKRIRLDDKHYLEYKLEYNYSNHYTQQNSITSHRTLWQVQVGMGKNKILDETSVKRKDIKKLILLTKELTDEKLLEINKNTPLAPGYGMILQSEDFQILHQIRNICE